jgi:hypothetical protein
MRWSLPKSKREPSHLARIVIVSALLTVPHLPLAAQGGSPNRTVTGALIGAGIGVGTGILFAHESCDMDPCIAEAYLFAGAVGAVLLAGSGAVIGLKTGRSGAVGARDGALLGGILGGAAGVILVATTCDDECGVAGYTSLAVAGAGVLGAIGALIGGSSGSSSSIKFTVGSARLEPILAPVPGRTVIGARLRM